MAYITQKKVNGSIYYYAEQRVWKNGKSTREWQKYLGSIEKIISAAEQQVPNIEHSIIFEHGNVAAYLSLAEELSIEHIIDSLLPKRQQGISIGRYLLIAAINRGVHSVSKNSMWNWYEQTMLFHYWNNVKMKHLSSQRFWDNMDLIPESKISDLWVEIIRNTVEVKKIDLSKICYDGTNYYTFISSFNSRNTIAKNGKNKQGRKDLRQINYALFCSQEDHIPLYFDVYEGNRHDSPEFKKIIEEFGQCFKTKVNPEKNLTVIFDKGNNAKENIDKLEANKLHYIGSIKLNQVKAFETTSNNDTRLVNCTNPLLKDYKVFRDTQQVFGRDMTVLLIYNPNLYDSQLKTVLNDINKSIEALSALKQNLQDRMDGLITKGKKPTETGTKNKVQTILKRQYMKQLIQVEYTIINNLPMINYNIEESKLTEIKDKTLGKKIIFTDNHHWKTEDIIVAYNNQAVIENLFKETKNRNYSTWWPQYHFTDQKVKVHGLYCTITLLLRSLIGRELRLKNIKLSMERLHDQLGGIKQVVNVFSKYNKHKQKSSNMTKMNEIQSKLFKIFNMKKYMTN